jgi:hypothetical protein
MNAGYSTTSTAATANLSALESLAQIATLNMTDAPLPFSSDPGTSISTSSRSSSTARRLSMASEHDGDDSDDVESASDYEPSPAKKRRTLPRRSARKPARKTTTRTSTLASTRTQRPATARKRTTIDDSESATSLDDNQDATQFLIDNRFIESLNTGKDASPPPTSTTTGDMALSPDLTQLVVDLASASAAGSTASMAPWTLPPTWMMAPLIRQSQHASLSTGIAAPSMTEFLAAFWANRTRLDPNVSLSPTGATTTPGWATLATTPVLETKMDWHDGESLDQLFGDTGARHLESVASPHANVHDAAV